MDGSGNPTGRCRYQASVGFGAGLAAGISLAPPLAVTVLGKRRSALNGRFEGAKHRNTVCYLCLLLLLWFNLDAYKWDYNEY